MSSATRARPFEISTVWDGTWGQHCAASLNSQLPWRVRPDLRRSSNLGDMTMGHFTRALREAQIIDNLAIDSAGAGVVLPFGADLLERFRHIVRAAYRSAGLAEHEYPHLIPVSLARPTAAVVDLHDRLLLVGTASELAQGEAPMTLTPTGEMVIYSHWSRAVASRGDLPIRMFRRARYFRPASRGRHSGRGVFYGAEHDDIFEFHCAHADREQQQRDIDRLRVMTVDLINRLHVPVLWSTRPPWTNRAEVADRALAADAPLPLRLTAQVAALYDQGARFSKPYRIGFREHGSYHHTEQLAGYVSRRLLMAHLMLGLHQRGKIFLHPDVAPVQVLLLTRHAGTAPPSATANLVTALSASNILVYETCCRTATELTRAMREWVPRGIPVIVQAFEPRAVIDRWKIVIRRADTDEEQTVYSEDPVRLVEELRILLADVGSTYVSGAWHFARERIQATAAAELSTALDHRLVAVTPLAATEEATQAVAALGAGEVLGYCRTERSENCALTGMPVRTVAFISPRL